MVRGPLIRLLALLVCLGAGPAWSDRVEWPALHDVTGVQRDDILNVRAQPQSIAQIIGSLAHDRTHIEVVRPDSSGNWGLVNVGDLSGWASLRYLNRQPMPQSDVMPAIRRCFGTEPFWTLRINGDAVDLTALGESQISGQVQDRLRSDGRVNVHAVRIDMPDGITTAIVREQACSDGMSERAYGLTVDLLSPTRLRSGCCSLAP